MKMHKTYKITLALLAVMLAVVGTTTTVVHAEGPGDEPEFAATMNSETLATFHGLTPEEKGIVEEAWTQIRNQAPREHWDADIEWVIEILAADEVESGQGGQSSTPVARELKGVLRMSVGHTSGLTIYEPGNEALTVTVFVFRGSNGPTVSSTGFCSDCRVVYTSVSQPENVPGFYTARGVHRASNPQGEKSTYTTLRVH